MPKRTYVCTMTVTIEAPTEEQARQELSAMISHPFSPINSVDEWEIEEDENAFDLEEWN